MWKEIDLEHFLEKYNPKLISPKEIVKSEISSTESVVSKKEPIKTNFSPKFPVETGKELVNTNNQSLIKENNKSRDILLVYTSKYELKEKTNKTKLQTSQKVLKKSNAPTV